MKELIRDLLLKMAGWYIKDTKAAEIYYSDCLDDEHVSILTSALDDLRETMYPYFTVDEEDSDLEEGFTSDDLNDDMTAISYCHSITEANASIQNFMDKWGDRIKG